MQASISQGMLHMLFFLNFRSFIIVNNISKETYRIWKYALQCTGIFHNYFLGTGNFVASLDQKGYD